MAYVSNQGGNSADYYFLVLSVCLTDNSGDLKIWSIPEDCPRPSKFWHCSDPPFELRHNLEAILTCQILQSDAYCLLANPYSMKHLCVHIDIQIRNRFRKPWALRISLSLIGFMPQLATKWRYQISDQWMFQATTIAVLFCITDQI